MSKTRWGIIGAGRIAKTFAQDIRFCDNAELVGVASRNECTAKRFALDYDVTYAYGCYESLYSDPNIDAVYIATPHNLHFEQTLDAFSHGKAVLCEKPLNVNPSETERLIAAADEEKCYLMEGMWTYCLPALEKAKSWLNDGKIGQLKHIKVDLGYPVSYSPELREYNPRLAGGCLLEMGIYPVALAHFFKAEQPHSIHAVGRFAPNGVEDDVVAIFDYNDCVASIATSFRAKLQNWAYIIGSEGYIAIPDFWRASECHRYVLDEKVESFEDNRLGSGFEFEIGAASDDIIQGKKQSEIISLKDSLTIQKQLYAIKQQISH